MAQDAAGTTAPLQKSSADAAPASDVRPLAADKTDASPAYPAAPQGDQLGEIIVTAERREANIQRTPIAITAVGGDTLRKSQIVDIEGLTDKLANVTFGRNSGSTKIFIRGIGLDSLTPGSDPRVAIYSDGVYNARSQTAFNALFDVERVEVLGGPQGTLYGRNATAGAINIISRDPTDSWDGFGTLTIGDYSLVQSEGAVGGPLTDTLSGRIAFHSTDRNGFGHNIENGDDVDDEHTRAVRGKMLFKPSAEVRFLLTADYNNEHDHSNSYHYLGDTPGNVLFSKSLGYATPSNTRDYAGLGPLMRLKNYGVSGLLNINLGRFKFVSLTAYRGFSQNLLNTADGATSNFIPIYIEERAKQFSEEVRLTRTVGALDTLVGGYYFHERNKAYLDAPINGTYFGLQPELYNASLNGGQRTTDAWALFSQETLHLSNRLGVDVGLRYSHETQRANESAQVDFTNLYDPSRLFVVNPALATIQKRRRTWTALDPKVTMHYNFTNDIFGYGTYSVGFKSGGFNLGGVQPPFNPEKLTDYELGLKADLLDHRLRANVSAFLYDYRDLQVSTIQGIVFVTANAARARLYGVEGSLIALPTQDLRVELNVAYLHATYTDYFTSDPGLPAQPTENLAGNELPYAPKLKANGEIAYTIHSGLGDLVPRIDAIYSSRVYFSQYDHPYISQKSRVQIDLYLGYSNKDSSWSGGLFMRNATNRYYLSAATVNSNFIGYDKIGQIGPPRTFGAFVAKHFR